MNDSKIIPDRIGSRVGRRSQVNPRCQCDSRKSEALYRLDWVDTARIVA
jgi:hypothetical protein